MEPQGHSHLGGKEPCTPSPTLGSPDSPLLVENILQQAWAWGWQLQGVEGSAGGPGGGGQAHVAGQPLDLVQAQQALGPGVLPNLLPEGFQAWKGSGRERPRVSEGCGGLNHKQGEGLQVRPP